MVSVADKSEERTAELSSIDFYLWVLMYCPCLFWLKHYCIVFQCDWIASARSRDWRFTNHRRVSETISDVFLIHLSCQKLVASAQVSAKDAGTIDLVAKTSRIDTQRGTGVSQSWRF